jgi:5-methylcytosine-specific restriction endonuclease McrA
MGVVARIRRSMQVEKRMEIYASKNRFIPTELHKRLKAVKKCQHCKMKLKKAPQIHHIKQVCRGGQNTEENLMAVCPECHKILDQRDGVHE